MSSNKTRQWWGTEKMKDKTKAIWFPAKTHGIGWGLPARWQGWAVMAIYVLLMIAGSIVLTQPGWKMIVFPIYIVVLTILFVFVCWKKGDSLKWNWGKGKKEQP